MLHEDSMLLFVYHFPGLSLVSYRMDLISPLYLHPWKSTISVHINSKFQASSLLFYQCIARTTLGFNVSSNFGLYFG